MSTQLWAAGVALAGLMAVLSCSSDAGPTGQLVVAVQTDMQLPDDVDRVRLQVESFGKLVFAREYPVAPDGTLRIPATLGILPGSDPARTVTIGLAARQRGRVRVLREAVTTIPTQRAAMLRLPIQWLCDGQVEELEPGEVDSTCPDVDGKKQTCIAGTCADAEVDSSLLPDYDPAEIFGGGDGSGNGECFDTVPCFAEGVGATPDAECTIAVPDEGDFEPSIAIVNPPQPGSAGICGPGSCLISLDANTPNGWQLTEDEDRIQLPPAVCDRIASGISVGVAVTTACPQKTEALPSCGPWSAVTETPGSFDAGPPADVAVGMGSSSGECAVPGDTSRGALCLNLAPAQITVSPGDEDLDGMGVLVVSAFTESSIDLAGEVPTPLETFTFPESGEISISELPSIRFGDLPPGAVYVLAQFWDNPDETALSQISRGGAWLGGLDLSNGFTGDLTEFTVDAGGARSITLPMRAVRRLVVSASLGPDVSAFDDANGWLEWAAYTTPNPTASTVPIGRGVRACATLLTGGPTTSQGFVIGSGPHFIVATLDDYDVGAGGEFAGTVAGSLVSGSGTGGSWDIPPADGIQFPQGSYSRSFSVELTTAVPTEAPPPDPFQCSLGECGDGDQNGDETDVDCGGGCAPCADGLACAGAADCQSRVCAGSECIPPACDDGVQNGAETDQDCGGDCTPCADALRCQVDGDCVSGSCVLSVCEGSADAGAGGIDASAQ